MVLENGNKEEYLGVPFKAQVLNTKALRQCHRSNQGLVNCIILCNSRCEEEERKGTCYGPGPSDFDFHLFPGSQNAVWEGTRRSFIY